MNSNIQASGAKRPNLSGLGVPCIPITLNHVLGFLKGGNVDENTNDVSVTGIDEDLLAMLEDQILPLINENMKKMFEIYCGASLTTNVKKTVAPQSKCGLKCTGSAKHMGCAKRTRRSSVIYRSVADQNAAKIARTKIMRETRAEEARVKRLELEKKGNPSRKPKIPADARTPPRARVPDVQKTVNGGGRRQPYAGRAVQDNHQTGATTTNIASKAKAPTLPLKRVGEGKRHSSESTSDDEGGMNKMRPPKFVGVHGGAKQPKSCIKRDVKAGSKPPKLNVTFDREVIERSFVMIDINAADVTNQMRGISGEKNKKIPFWASQEGLRDLLNLACAVKSFSFEEGLHQFNPSQYGTERSAHDHTRLNRFL
uniref:INCENP_ARK-bind domain-containing protein n=1 Tax=Rhabditophanes sp. KR3021 TaxID=114890 RepID=A0AC35TGS5_9BILA